MRKSDNQANIGNIARVKEYIICYARDRSKLVMNKMKLTERAKKEYRYSDEGVNLEELSCYIKPEVGINILSQPHQARHLLVRG